MCALTLAHTLWPTSVRMYYKHMHFACICAYVDKFMLLHVYNISFALRSARADRFFWFAENAMHAGRLNVT